MVLVFDGLDAPAGRRGAHHQPLTAVPDPRAPSSLIVAVIIGRTAAGDVRGSGEISAAPCAIRNSTPEPVD
jgi:hypothetical protein